MVVIAAGCGSDSDGTDASATTTTVAGDQDQSADLSDPEAFAQDLYDKAKAAGETKVSYYTSMVPAQFAAVNEAWTKKYPDITVEHVRADLGQTLERVLAEHRAGTYIADVISTNESSFGALMDEKLLAKFDSPTRDHWIEPFKSDFNGYQFPSRVLQVGFAVNTKAVSKDDYPHSWKDLTDPKWKGKLGMADPRVGGGAQQWFVTLWDDDNFGPEFLEALAANEPLVKPGIVQVQQSAELGEVDVDVVAYDYVVLPARDEGKPIDFVLPEDGTIVAATSDSVAAKAPNPNAARLFVDFLMSEEGQAALTKAYVSPVHSEVEPNPSAPARGDIEILSTGLTEEQVGKLDDYVAKMNETFNLR
jgi:iron(III) transport system substrate-binding protein